MVDVVRMFIGIVVDEFGRVEISGLCTYKGNAAQSSVEKVMAWN